MLALVLMLATQSAVPAPEDCVLRRGERAAATAEYKGKTYEFRQAACKDEFLSDPERYSQLYDALAELAAEGVAVERSRDASLVPS